MATNNVTGTVYSSITDKVVPKATVTASCTGDSTTSTTADENGYFDFNVPQESCTFSGGSDTYLVGLTITSNSEDDQEDVLEMT